MDNIYSAYHYACKTKADREAIESILPRAEEAANKAFWGNIGDIKYTARTSVPNGGAWCDGTSYSKDQYPDVYKMLTDGKLLSIDVDSYNSTIETSGSCGLFGLDTVNESFRVPTVKALLLNKEEAAVVGNGMTLGLTDGTNNAALTQATYLQTTTGSYGEPVGGTKGDGVIADGKILGVTTDPTKSGIVANLDTVEYRAYIVLFTAEKELSVVNWTNQINQVAADRMAELQAGGLTTIKYWE